MCSKYDENLNENVFFKTLTTEYKNILKRAVLEKWLICIPCSESLLDYEVNFGNILNHILVPSQELPETHYETLYKTQVCLNDMTIKLNADRCYDVPILFSETYYTEDRAKCDILCLERPIGTTDSHSKLRLVRTLRDCIDLLLTDSEESMLLVEKLDQMINRTIQDQKLTALPYDKQRSLITHLYKCCLDVTLGDLKIARKCAVSKCFLNNVKMSIESYIQHNVYPIVMKAIVTDMTDELAEFNKVLRKITELQTHEMGLEDIDSDSLLRARNELSRLDGYSTVLGKYNCLKRSLNGIRRKPNRSNATESLSTDELLPTTVFLIAKSGLPSWISQLKYTNDFILNSSDCYNEELFFLISTFEAAITYIRSEMFFTSATNFTINNNSIISAGLLNVHRILLRTSNSSLRNLFRMIVNDDLTGMIDILENSSSSADGTPETFQYCHPLCSCDRCEKLTLRTVCDRKITVNTVNDAGITAVHVAACCGKSAVVDALLQRGADPNLADYSGYTPLHYAAQYGCQGTLLLLMYADAKLDECENDGNTALNLAASNGHEDCVKALLYFAEHAGVPLNVNSCNNEGDSALHQAVRWYFKNIAKILLTYNADVTVKNKHRLTAFDLTQSKYIVNLLNDTYYSINLLRISVNYRSRSDKDDTVDRAVDFSDEDETIRVKPRGEEYGARPQTAECIKKVDKLFKAIKNNDLATVKYYLGFDESSDSLIDRYYKCHPLCRCEQCSDNNTNDIIAEDEDSVNGNNSDDFVVVKQNLNIDICDSDGMTALHTACLYGKVEVVRFLLDIGVKPNVRTYRQLSAPLHLASQNQHIGIVKMLINTATCKINLQDASGNTALHYACIAGNSHLVEVILKAEPNVDIRNNAAKTALKEAEDNFSFLIVTLFKNRAKTST